MDGNQPYGGTTTSPGASDKILFWASFFTLIAAGIGFSVRGAILKDWGEQFGFTQSELGTITGGGLMGFGLAIIFFSFFADRFGYGKLMLVAFLLHTASAVVTLAATYVYATQGKEGAYWCLYAGMWLFALGNGTCEAVINPLTATLFPHNKTHWLNILHAGWPLGLILGAVIVLGFGQIGTPIRWEFKLGIFLVPVMIYGLLMCNRKFPQSEATASGVSTGSMIVAIFSPILLFLFFLHALVGYVELGTDSWITNITERVLANQDMALLAFIWTNLLMFTLRFFAGPIVHRINPIGLLFLSAILGTAGLYMLGQPSVNSVWPWVLAVTIYGIGKTFYWPTMLGVISERFPKGGALALGLSGGIGMISAGVLGGPGIGYKQDYFAVEKIKELSTPAYDRYKATEPSGFPILTGFMPDKLPLVAGLDNSKLKVFDDFKGNVKAVKAATEMKAVAEKANDPANPPVPVPLLLSEKFSGPKDYDLAEGDTTSKVSVTYISQADYDKLVKKEEADKKTPPKLLMTTLQSDMGTLNKLKAESKPVEAKLEESLTKQTVWWETEGEPSFSASEKKLDEARLFGAKHALLYTAAIPAVLAIGYLLLLLYFAVTGGYKQVHLESGGREVEVRE